jgi:hypothetical protein
MSKHTPGPWTLETVRTQVGACHKIGPFPGDDRIPAKRENYACVYADWEDFENKRLTDRGQMLLANARLIAAAPDLLAALERMLLVAPAFHSRPIGAPGSRERDMQTEHIAAELQARAAIACAKFNF